MKRGFMSASNCASSGRQPFSRPLKVGGNRDTISIQTVPEVSIESTNLACASSASERNSTVYFCHPRFNFPATLAVAYVAVPALSCREAVIVPLYPTAFAQRERVYFRPLTALIPQYPSLTNSTFPDLPTEAISTFRALR